MGADIHTDMHAHASNIQNRSIKSTDMGRHSSIQPIYTECDKIYRAHCALYMMGGGRVWQI